MLSDERFDALLDGDEPRDEIERQLITNYRAKQEERRKERELEDQKRLQERQQGYREYYKLIKDTFPEDFFYNKEINGEEYFEFTERQAKKYAILYAILLTGVRKNKILRKLYGYNDKYVPFIDSYHEDKLIEKKVLKVLGEKYKFNYQKQKELYDKYATPEFKKQIEIIKDKYDIILETEFDLDSWLDDYDSYNV